MHTDWSMICPGKKIIPGRKQGRGDIPPPPPSSNSQPWGPPPKLMERRLKLTRPSRSQADHSAVCFFSRIYVAKNEQRTLITKPIHRKKRFITPQKNGFGSHPPAYSALIPLLRV
eukprot:TRINITY_DN504_c0_g1_i2.p1 TRINITY_DN504_c0_g1~~TRINITY_DN504_c0_g1_i2.p1  ORF type:complete len:115 (+),score=42.93 TRINITY_DN504_c0_g1_i2:54-398(+)